MQIKSDRIARFFAFIAGLTEAIVAFSLLFLPVFARCTGNGPSLPLTCEHYTYLQQGGGVTGIFFFTVMFVLGLLGVITAFIKHNRWTCFWRWSLIASSFMIAFLAFSGIGLLFLPGALLMLLPAISCLRSNRGAKV